MFRLFLGALFVAVATLANAAEPSKSALADMGFSDLEPVNEMLIRGKGYAHVYGLSVAYVGSHKGAAGSTNGYKAVSRTRWSEAAGENQSFAAYNGHQFIAGGFSFATAK